MNEKDFEKIESMIYRHVGTFADSIQHKLDLVVLAADLKAHRQIGRASCRERVYVQV
jgi:hypothetical protein